jgi:hypothetical protein
VTDLLDFKVRISDNAVDLLDLKTRISDDAVDLLDLKAKVYETDTDLLDFRTLISVNVKQHPIPVAIFELTISTEIVLRYATSYYVDELGNEYLSGLVWPTTKEALKDIQYGIERSNSISITIKNAGRGLSTDLSMATIAETYNLKTKWARLTNYDPISGEAHDDMIDFFGKVDSCEWDDTGITLNLNNSDDAVFNQLLPKDVVSLMCHTTAIQEDRGKPINMPLGPCLRIPCPNCKNDTTTDEYDYVVGYYGTSLPTTVYRTKIVPSSEYTFLNNTTYPGYLVIRFTEEQVDYGGNHIQIFADVDGFGWASAGATGIGDSSHILDALHTVLGSPHGIADPYGVDLTSSVGLIQKLIQLEGTTTTADFKYWCSINIGGTQKRAGDWLDEILKYSPVTPYRKYNGKWTVSVDIVKDVSFYFGYNDGFYKNCVINKKYDTPASQAKALVKLQYGFYENMDGKAFNYEIEKQAVEDYGTDTTIELRAVNRTVTAKKYLSNIVNKEIYSDPKIDITCGPEAKTARRGDRFWCYTDYDGGVYGDYLIEQITMNRSKSFNIIGRTYDVRLFDDLTIDDPTDPEEDTTEINGPGTLVGTVTHEDDTQESVELTVQEISKYVIGGMFNGVPGTATYRLLCHKFKIPVHIPADMVGSCLDAGVAATAESVWTIKKGSTSIGTATFAAAGTSATISFASAVSFAVDDTLYIWGPATNDTTLADFSWTITFIKESTFT